MIWSAGTRTIRSPAIFRTSQNSQRGHPALVGARTDQQSVETRLLAGAPFELDIVDDPAPAFVACR